MNLNCPICNKAGLPDYTIHHTICPQCNSDLYPYLLLKSISTSKFKTFSIAIISLLLLTTIVLASLYILSNNKINSIERLSSVEIKSLKDSITSIKSNQNISSNDVSIIYKVKSGDCTSKIANLFYNDWRLHKKIESDNGLTSPYKLSIGQELIIKLEIK